MTQKISTKRKLVKPAAADRVQPPGMHLVRGDRLAPVPAGPFARGGAKLALVNAGERS